MSTTVLTPAACAASLQQLPAKQYSTNAGCFRKGYTPWNKGKTLPGNSRAVKGRQGFPPREVVALNADGTVRNRFPSVEAARRFFGLRDRHSITQACRGKFFCRGHRLMYADDYIPWADFRNKRPRGRDIYGRLLPGHSNAGFRKLSPEKLHAKSERSRQLSYRLAHDPASKWGKGENHQQPVVCTDTGEQFPSMKAASEHYGILPNQISLAISRHGKCHGLTFKKL